MFRVMAVSIVEVTEEDLHVIISKCRSIVDFLLMLNSTSLGFEPDFFNLSCQRLNHSAVEVLYKLRLYSPGYISDANT